MWPFNGIGKGRGECEAAERALEAGDLGGAGQQFSQVVTKFGPKAAKSTARAELAARATIGLGRISLASNDPNGALTRFREARTLLPASGAGAYWEGCAAGHLGDYAHAEFCFGIALQLGDPAPGRVAQQRAYARLRLGRPDEAAEDLLAAAAQGGLTGNGPLIAGLLRARSGDWTDAAQAAGKATGPVAAAVTGFARHQAGDASGAFAQYQRALDGGPHIAGSLGQALLELMGTAALAAGQPAAALSAFQVLRAERPSDDRLVGYAQAARRANARDLLRAGDATGAAELFRALPGGDEALFSEAAMLVTDTSATPTVARRALLAYRKSVPADPRAQHLLAHLAWTGGDGDEAARVWSMLPATDPRRRLGLALCASGDPDPGRVLPDLADLASSLADGGIDDPWPARQAARLAAAIQFRLGGWSALDPAILRLAASGSVHTTSRAVDLGMRDDQRRDSLPAESPEGWLDLRAEALYRDGRTAELNRPIAPPNIVAWLTLARIEEDLSSGDGPRAVRPQDLSGAAHGWGQRPRSALAVVGARAALDAAATGEWAAAAAWLELAADLDPDRFQGGAGGLAIGLIRGLGGDRTAGIAALGRAASQSPGDHRLGHARALMLLHALSSDSLRLPDRPALWRSCIGACIALLHDQAFLDHWRRGAQARYGTPVTDATFTAAREGVRKLLEDRVGSQAADGVPLAVLLRREVAAAEGNTAAARFPGGPLHVAELGRLREFSRLAQSSQEMMLLFSRAGLASVELDAGHATQAAELAQDLRCAQCRSAGSGSGGAAAKAGTDNQPPLLCQANCPNFERENPAFPNDAESRATLTLLGSAVAARALMDVARAAASAQPPDLALAGRSWKRAARLGDTVGLGADARSEVVETAQGRLRALEHRQDWDTAIELLDAALPALDGDSARHDKIAGETARLLNIRAASVVNDDLDKAEDAVRDLARALTLRPSLLRARVNKATLLNILGVKRANDRKFAEAMTLLSQAVGECDSGLKVNPGDEKLTEVRSMALQNYAGASAGYGWSLYDQAAQQVKRNDLYKARTTLKSAADALAKGLKADPKNADLVRGNREVSQALRLVGQAIVRRGGR